MCEVYDVRSVGIVVVSVAASLACTTGRYVRGSEFWAKGHSSSLLH